MKKIILAVCLLFSVSTLLFACDGSSSSKSLGKGKVMVLELESNPSTGYDWVYETTGDAELFLDREDYRDANDANMVGAGGIRVLYFKGTKEGSANLVLTYKRPWEGGETAYDVVYELSVDKDMNITCLSKTKGVVNSDKELSFFPNPKFEKE